MDEDLREILDKYHKYIEQKINVYFDVDEITQLVDYFIGEGLKLDVKKVLDLGLYLHPDNVFISFRYVKYLYYWGDKNLSVKMLKELPDIEDIDILMFKGEVALDYNEINLACVFFDRVLMLIDEKEEMISTCLEISEDFMNINAYDKAIIYLVLAEKISPENIEIHSDLALCYQQVENYKESIKQQNYVIDKDPFSADAWFNMGLLYCSLGDFSKGLEAFDYSLSINDKDSTVLFQKAIALFQLNNYEKALEVFKQYVKYPDVDKVESYANIGDCYLRMEKYGMALRNYHVALNIDIHNVQSLFGVGVSLLETNKYKDSIVYFDKVIKEEPENIGAWVYKAQSYAMIDDNIRAENCFKKAIGFDETKPDVYVSYGTFCFENKDYKKAEILLKKAFEMDPNFQDLAVILSATYYKLGKDDKFRFMFLKAMKLQNDAIAKFFDYCPELENDISDILKKSLIIDSKEKGKFINKKRKISAQREEDKKKK